MKVFTIAALVLVLFGCTPLVTQEQIQQAPASPQGAAPPPLVDPAQPFPYEFTGIQQWFNLESVTNQTSLTRKELVGKVVLVDFWTYSCINCIRTLPYLTSWDQKYRDDGLVIVGVHAPEFSFEHDPANVAAALRKYSVRYPVGLDNDMATWAVYQNRYWPHSYLFDRSGKLVFDHVGEGGYDEVERRIQELLAVEAPLTEGETPRFGSITTPEIYLGGGTNRGNTAYDVARGEHTFTFDKPLRNTVQLGGTWTVEDEYITAGADATLQLLYHAKAIHVVAAGQGTISGTRDDTALAEVPIDGEQLYTLSSTDYQDHTVLLHIDQGVRLYSFTFG